VAPLASAKEVLFLLFAGFWLNVLPQLNTEAAHNVKTKSLGIIPTPWAAPSLPIVHQHLKTFLFQASFPDSIIDSH